MSLHGDGHGDRERRKRSRSRSRSPSPSRSRPRSEKIPPDWPTVTSPPALIPATIEPEDLATIRWVIEPDWTRTNKPTMPLPSTPLNWPSSRDAVTVTSPPALIPTTVEPEDLATIRWVIEPDWTRTNKPTMPLPLIPLNWPSSRDAVTSPPALIPTTIELEDLATIPCATEPDCNSQTPLGPTVAAPLSEYEQGTTTLGLNLLEDGIIVAVDHSWVSDGLPENVLKINSHLLLAFSGGTKISRRYLLKELQDECSAKEQLKGGKLTADELIQLLSSYLSCHPDSDKGSSLGILIAGWDSDSASAFLYKVNGKGEHYSGSIVGTGSGSPGRALLLSGLSMRLSRAINVCKTALYIGLYNVPTCLEYLAIFHIGQQGVETKVINESIADLQKKDFQPRGMPSRRFLQ